MALDDLIDPKAQPEKIADGFKFTEGPVYSRRGYLLFSDIPNSRIMKWERGRASVFRENSNGANGLVFDAQGRLIACEGSRGKPPRVTRTDMTTGKVEILASASLNAPNDVTLDGKGRIYFTDPAPGVGKDAVYRIDLDGKISRILSGAEIEQPNGLIISPDDRTLYLVESNGQERGARMIRAYDLQPDGSLRNMRVFHNFYPGRSADGLCIDSRGNIHAAAGLHSRRGTHETLDTRPGVHVFSPEGKLLRFIPVPEDTITNCAFGGADLKTLYVTAGKSLFRFPVDIPGTRR